MSKVVFSVDVEDGISIAMRDSFGMEINQTDQVLRCTQKILDLLDQYDVKATFFVLGKVGKDFPGLIKDISEAGHELAIHGFNHYRFDQMTPDEAFNELTTAKKLIEDISGQQIFGHRAPAFSLMPQTSWAFEQIKRAGFEYDSSIMPCKASHYGWKGFETHISEVELHSTERIFEVPMSTVNIGNIRMPGLGGSYFRLLPYSITRWSVNQVLSNKHTPILYFHPYELDTDRYPDAFFEQLNKQPLLKRLKMRSNWLKRGSVLSKMRQTLRNYKFITMKDKLDELKKSNVIPTIHVSDY